MRPRLPLTLGTLVLEVVYVLPHGLEVEGLTSPVVGTETTDLLPGGGKRLLQGAGDQAPIPCTGKVGT